MNYILFKNTEIEDRFSKVKTILKNIAASMSIWAAKKELPFVITEALTTLEEDTILKRVSSTHREGRAIDVSVHGWTLDNITDFVNEFNDLFKDVAATSNSGIKTLVVYHNSGHGNHFHIQVRRGLS